MRGRRISPIVVGRQRELDAIDRRLDAVLAGDAVHLAVTGEAGIGKSRFVDAVASRATERGIRVLHGACASPGTGGTPYGPLIEAMRSAARDLEPEALATAVGPSGPDLARLVPGLGPAPPPGVEGLETHSLRGRLLEGLLGFLQRLSRSTPVLLVIEDLHWADPASRDAVAFLLRNLRADPVLLVVTVRTDELHRHHPLLPWLVELERSGRVERLELARLDLDETAEMLAAILGTPPPATMIERVHARADGNPFFVEELAIAQGAGSGASRLSPTLRDILRARIAAVPEVAQAVIDVAAVAGRRVEYDLLAAVAGLDEAALTDGLRAAIEARLIIVDLACPGRSGDRDRGLADGARIPAAIHQQTRRRPADTRSPATSAPSWRSGILPRRRAWRRPARRSRADPSRASSTAGTGSPGPSTIAGMADRMPPYRPSVPRSTPWATTSGRGPPSA